MPGIRGAGRPRRARSRRSCATITCGEQTRRLARELCVLRGGSPKLVVLCGPSHSGKTTFARALRGRLEIVSSDELRKRLSGRREPSEDDREVWDAFESMKLKALRAGHSVVLDACHMSKRARWHSLQGPNGRHRKICVVFDVPLSVILARCRKTGRLPMAEAERMWRVFQRSKPSRRDLLREGYDEVCVIRGTRRGGT